MRDVSKNAITTEIAVLNEDKKAKDIAHTLFAEIESLEKEIVKSKQLASQIENRGFFKKTFSSSSKDLVAIQKSQNSINDKMVGLTQETIKLNMLSYAGLVCLMDEMRKGIEGGFTDANGNITKLGKNGRELAETATNIISGILDSSKDTQIRIEKNAGEIARINQELDEKKTLDKKLKTAIGNLLKRSDEKQVQINEHKVEIEKLIVQISLLDEKIHRMESTLQQYESDNAIGHIIQLKKSARNWQYVTIALALIPMIWLVVITWFNQV